MNQENVKVLWNTPVGPSVYRIGLSCHPGYVDAAPGQFVMLRVSDRSVPLLRRPFSIHMPISEVGGIRGIELLYKAVGEGTRVLSRCRQGDVLDMLGPLGKGFRISGAHRRIVIVAGGIGVAPMLFLASNLAEKGVDPGGCSVFLGGRSKTDLLCRTDFLNLNMTLHLTTEDGSAGAKGLVTQPLEVRIKEDPPDVICACGPAGMLKAVYAIAQRHGIDCQISIETMMACGLGACLACAVEDSASQGRYRHACLDGPVFPAGEIIL
jgi:dihydroorotate dehydrogenase electron transfer subunit